MAKYLDDSGLSRYDSKIKTYIANAIASADEVGLVTLGTGNSGTLTAEQIAECQKSFAVIFHSGDGAYYLKSGNSGAGTLTFKQFLNVSASGDAPTYSTNNRTISVNEDTGGWVRSTTSVVWYSDTKVDNLLLAKQNVLTAGSNITISGSTISATDTTYSAGTGLSLSGTTFNHSNSVTAGTAGTSSATSGETTISIPYVTYDAQGHITASGTHTHTITAGSVASGSTGFVTGGAVYTALQGYQPTMTAITNAEIDALFS